MQPAPVVEQEDSLVRPRRPRLITIDLLPRLLTQPLLTRTLLILPPSKILRLVVNVLVPVILLIPIRRPPLEWVVGIIKVTGRLGATDFGVNLLGLRTIPNLVDRPLKQPVEGDR